MKPWKFLNSNWLSLPHTGRKTLISNSLKPSYPVHRVGREPRNLLKVHSQEAPSKRQRIDPFALSTTLERLSEGNLPNTLFLALKKKTVTKHTKRREKNRNLKHNCRE